jgi:polyisoprenoid-binding protein YceI
MSVLPASGTYAIDASHSYVGFAVKHFGLSKVKGEFQKFDGAITIADPVEGSSVEVTIQADSFNSRDEQRDTHIRSADFLDVLSYPTLSFASTGVRRSGDDWLVTGALTVHGVTRPVELSVEFEGAIDDPYGLERIAFSATAEIDRTDFGLTWNQALETGGLVVGKKVKVNVEVEAVRPKV